MATGGNDGASDNAKIYPNESVPMNGGYGQHDYGYNCPQPNVGTCPNAPLVPGYTDQRPIDSTCNNACGSPPYVHSNYNGNISNYVHATPPTNFIQGYSYEPIHHSYYNCSLQYSGYYHQQQNYQAYPNIVPTEDINNQFHNLSFQDISYARDIGHPYNNIPHQSNGHNSPFATPPEHQQVQYPYKNVVLPSTDTSSYNTEASESSDDSECSSNSSSALSIAKKRGRPRVYKTKKARKAAKNEAQKRYAGRKKATIEVFKIEVPALERRNRELKARKEALLKVCRQMLAHRDLPDFERNVVGEELVQLE